MGKKGNILGINFNFLYIFKSSDRWCCSSSQDGRMDSTQRRVFWLVTQSLLQIERLSMLGRWKMKSVMCTRKSGHVLQQLFSWSNGISTQTRATLWWIKSCINCNRTFTCKWVNRSIVHVSYPVYILYPAFSPRFIPSPQSESAVRVHHLYCPREIWGSNDNVSMHQFIFHSLPLHENRSCQASDSTLRLLSILRTTYVINMD